MRHDDYKNLKGEIKNKNFFNGYGIFSKISYYLSFVGNFFSIFLAFFFVNDIISQTVLEPSSSSIKYVFLITVVILFTVELVKRFVFDKFSMEAIKQKFKFRGPEMNILAFFSLLLIAASFYLSLNGAKEYASKDDEIKQNTEIVIEVYEDSLKTYYGDKITIVDKDISELRSANLSYDERLKMLDDKDEDLSVDTWQDRQEKRRIKDERKQIRDDKDRNIEQMDKLDIKIANYKIERNDEITKYKDKNLQKAEDKIEKNSDNPIRFLMFSTIIEFVILFGIFFINYYKVRSLEEYEALITKNPKYRLFNQWNELISLVYNKETQMGETLPFKTEMNKLLKANGLDISSKELDDALKMFTHLGILKKKGNKKAIAMYVDDARDLIKDHFKID